MEKKGHSITIYTTDVVHVYDEEIGLNWFMAFERCNGEWREAREMMNYENFKKMGGDYMQKVYDFAFKSITNPAPSGQREG